MPLTLHEIKEILNAKVLHGHNMLNEKIYSACGSDLMSDVLAFVKEQTLLLTGLTNHHVIPYGRVNGCICHCFCQGKHPAGDIVDMAKEHSIVLMSTSDTLFTACGKHIKQGYPGVKSSES